jgi:hypothetical protein
MKPATFRRVAECLKAPYPWNGTEIGKSARAPARGTQLDVLVSLTWYPAPWYMTWFCPLSSKLQQECIAVTWLIHVWPCSRQRLQHGWISHVACDSHGGHWEHAPSLQQGCMSLCSGTHEAKMASSGLEFRVYLGTIRRGQLHVPPILPSWKEFPARIRWEGSCVSHRVSLAGNWAPMPRPCSP